jgi:hypothetical protein
MAENTKPDPKTDGDPQMPKEFRENFDRVTEENKVLKETLRSTAFQSAGLDPAKGVGKAVATLYDGFDPAEITRIATEEFEWTPQTAAASSTEQQVAEATGRVNQVMGSSQSVQPQELETAIADAEREGRWSDAIALKMQKLRP